MDYSKLAMVIDKAVEEKTTAKGVHVRLGKVASVSGTTLTAIIDGSTAPAQMVKACSCAVGDRVVIIRQGTQFYVIGKVGG